MAQAVAPQTAPRSGWLAPAGVGLAAACGCVAVGLSDSDVSILPPCLFRTVTGLDCPGCGLSRGLRQLVRGHVGAALDHNVLLVVAVPLVAYLYLAWLGAAFGLRLPRLVPGPRTARVVVALAVAFAVVRNLPVGVGRYLNSTS